MLLGLDEKGGNGCLVSIQQDDTALIVGTTVRKQETQSRHSRVHAQR